MERTTTEVRVDLDGRVVVSSGAGQWRADHPVQVLVAADLTSSHRVCSARYQMRHSDHSGAVTAQCRVAVSAGVEIVVVDRWQARGTEVHLCRDVEVHGNADAGFAVRCALTRVDQVGSPGTGQDWPDLEVFAPGLVYGRAPQVPDWTLFGPTQLSLQPADQWVREDRLSAPYLSVRYPDGVALTVARADGPARTVTEDGRNESGGTVVDERIDVAAFGGTRAGDAVAIGVTWPACEGERTYTSGGLPLVGVSGWRRTLLPVHERVTGRVQMIWHAEHTPDAFTLLARQRERAWVRHHPQVRIIPADRYLVPVAETLDSQVRTGPDGHTGIGLESDPCSGEPIGDPVAVMGFVGANTDAAACLLRVAADITGERAERMRRHGIAMLDTFADLPLDPPIGEGWHLGTGSPTTYRTVGGRPAVHLRALAEGCHAALRAADTPGVPAAAERWRRWAVSGGRFLLGQQRPSGSFPRCWQAGTSVVLSESPTSTGTALRFLCALACYLPEARAAAVAVGTWVWRNQGTKLAYSGATLDNPDVVDKEAALLAAEGFLALHHMTGDRHWIARGLHAARVAETWVHLTDLPMPGDAHWPNLHWKPGHSTIGMQLITSGATMSDGFAQVNAACLVDLALRSGESWPVRVARLVWHGSKAMLATEDDTTDLAGPGWQQEHWGLGPRRGYGLNRHWLPWTAVAVLDGWARLRDLGPEVCALVDLEGVGVGSSIPEFGS